MFFAKGIAMPLFFIRRRLYVHEFHHTRGDARCRELQFHIFSPHPRAHPPAMKFKSTYFLPTSTCPSACRDARSERPGNFVYNQSETDFLICRTLRPSVPTESGALCRTHAKTKHGLSQHETPPFTKQNVANGDAVCHTLHYGSRRLSQSTAFEAYMVREGKPSGGLRAVGDIRPYRRPKPEVPLNSSSFTLRS